MKDLDTENYLKKLKKEIKEDTKKERYPMSMDWKNIAKMSTLPKMMYRLNATIKITMAFFTESEKKS